jgi:transcriptional regulator with XRE-family HTH domain
VRYRLKTERAKHGWTQAFVANCLGVTVRSYQYYEQGFKNPSLETANKLEDLFGIPQRELLVRNYTPIPV